MNMIDAPCFHSAAALDDKIVVDGGKDFDSNILWSVECIDVDALVQYAPLHYPLQPKVSFLSA